MKYSVALILILWLISCQQATEQIADEQGGATSNSNVDYTLVFVSCNDQEREQPLWKPIKENRADLFIWGGDNIYADTDDMSKMKSDYDKVWAHPDYASLAEETEITGTWDDHDFGKNDGGKEWEKKGEAKELLLDFLKVPNNDVRRTREGVYASEIHTTEKGNIKVILLDTRSFRDLLKKK